MTNTFFKSAPWLNQEVIEATVDLSVKFAREYFENNVKATSDNLPYHEKIEVCSRAVVSLMNNEQEHNNANMELNVPDNIIDSSLSWEIMNSHNGKRMMRVFFELYPHRFSIVNESSNDDSHSFRVDGVVKFLKDGNKPIIICNATKFKLLGGTKKTDENIFYEDGSRLGFLGKAKSRHSY